MYRLPNLDAYLTRDDDDEAEDVTDDGDDRDPREDEDYGDRLDYIYEGP